jgi:hypothetical protein
MGAFATVSVWEGFLEEKENPFNGRIRGPKGFERGGPSYPVSFLCSTGLETPFQGSSHKKHAQRRSLYDLPGFGRVVFLDIKRPLRPLTRGGAQCTRRSAERTGKHTQSKSKHRHNLVWLGRLFWPEVTESWYCWYYWVNTVLCF